MIKWFKQKFTKERILSKGEVQHIQRSSYDKALDGLGYSEVEKARILREFYKSKAHAD